MDGKSQIYHRNTMNDSNGINIVLDGMIRTLIERVNVNLNQTYDPKKQRVFPFI